MVRLGWLGWLSLAGALSAALLPACGEDEARRHGHDDAGEGGEGDAGSSGAGRGGSAGSGAGNAAHAGSGAGGSGASSGAGASGGSESDGGSSATAGSGAAGSDAGGSDAGGGESGSGSGGEGAETAGGSSGSAGMSGAGGVAAGGVGGAGAGSGGGGAGATAGAGGSQPGLTCRTVTFDDKSYLICPHAGLDWASARAYCLDLGADLISIETQDEDTWAYTEVIETGSIWTSANDLETEGDWRWGTGAALADGYQNWVPDQPNDAELGEDCAVLHSGGGDWNDVACSETIFTDPISFICEPP